MNEPNAFKYAMPVTFRLCDPAGIMFFANAYAVAHDAYEAFIASLGFASSYWFANPNWLVVIRHSACEHLRPIPASENIEIAVGIDEIKGSSFTTSYRLRLAGQGHDSVACELKFVHVFVDKKTMRPTRIPSEIRERLK